MASVDLVCEKSTAVWLADKPTKQNDLKQVTDECINRNHIAILLVYDVQDKLLPCPKH